MIPSQSCNYQPYTKLLTCTCPEPGSSSSLNLNLSVFVRDLGQEVRSVLVDSCSDLYISLDLREVNPTDIPFKFTNCGDLRFESIQFQGGKPGTQKLHILLEHVTRVYMTNLKVDEALQVSAVKVKEMVIHSSYFAHIPLPGIDLKQTDKLTIQDSIFPRIDPYAVTVDSNIRTVKVVNNEFNINAVTVVRTIAGEHLYISCNRLLDQASSPECAPQPTVPPPSPVWSPPPPSSPATMVVTTYSPPPMSQKRDGGVSTELLVGVAAGVAVVILLLILTIILVCCRNRRERRKEEDKEKEGKEEEEVVVKEVGEVETGGGGQDTDSGNNTTESGSEYDERKSLLTAEMESSLVEAQKPRFTSPVWLDDIHSNKLFNKQRSILAEDVATTNGDTKEILETRKPINVINSNDITRETPHRPGRPFPVRSISEIIDSDSDIEDDLPLPPPPFVEEEEEVVASVRNGLRCATETDL